MKLHNIIIGIVIIGLVISGFAVFLSNASSQYSLDDYNESDLAVYDGMNDINTMMDEYSEKESLVDADSGVLDKLGSLFASSYQSARVLKKSTTVMKDMTSQSLENNEILGGFGQVLSNGIITIIGIAILVGIFLHIITKSDRT